MATSNPGLYVALQQLTQIFAKTLTDVSEVFGQLASAAAGGVAAEGTGAGIAGTARVEEAAAAAPTPPPPVVIEPEPVAPVMAAPVEEVAEERFDTPEPEPEGPQTLQDILDATAALAPAPVPAPGSEPTDLIYVDQLGRELGIGASRIYGLIDKGAVNKYPPTGRVGRVSRAEVAKALKTARTRTLPPMPAGMVSTLEAAMLLDLGIAVLNKLIREKQFANIERATGNRLAIPIASVQAYASAHNITLREPKKPTVEEVSEEPESEPDPSVILERKLAERLVALEAEVFTIEPSLHSSPKDRIASRLAMWTGSVRKTQEDLQDIKNEASKSVIRKHVHVLLDKLRSLADLHDVWVNAASPDWSIEDWDLYIRAASGDTAGLSQEQMEVLEEGNLRSLVQRRHFVEVPQVRAVIEQARKVLGEDNAILVNTIRTFASKLLAPVVTSRAPAPMPLPTPEPDSPVSPFVLSLTAGKRMIIIGGQGVRDAHAAEYVKQFRLSSCEWLTHERSKVASLLRSAGRLTNRNFDMMIYLTGYTSHKANKLCDVARKGKLPVIKVPNGYSVASLAAAIEDQFPVPAPVAGLSQNGVHRRHA